jgi:integrase
VGELLNGQEVSEEDRKTLALGVIETFIKAREVSLGRTAGQSFTVLDMPAGPLVPAQPIMVQPPVEKPKPTTPAPLASEMLPGFMQHVALGEVRGQTQSQTEASVKLFLKAVGDRPVDSYGLADGQKYWNILRQLPPDHHKLGRGDEKRTIEEVIARGRQQAKGTLAHRSLQRHKNVLEGFLAYVFRQLPDRVNPQVKDMTSEWRMPKKTKAAHEERDPWSSDDLKALFQCPVWQGCKSEKRQLEPGTATVRNWLFWLPLLGLYTGARLEELCQLRGEDIRDVDGVWCFDINDRDGRLVKNPQSVRSVPVHPELLRLGFLQYVRAAAPNGSDRVFPTLKPMGPDNKLSFYPTRRFSSLCQTLGVPKRVTFHSFRHNVTSRLLNAEVPLPAVARMLGRTAEGGGETGNRYFKLEPRQALGYLCRLRYPEIAFPHLYVREAT